MRLLKIFGIIFAIHLIPLTFVFWLVWNFTEAGTAWVLFLLLDFPLSWFYFPVAPIVDQITEGWFWRELWRLHLAPAIFFQVVGCINWLLIYLFVSKIWAIIRQEI